MRDPEASSYWFHTKFALKFALKICLKKLHVIDQEFSYLEVCKTLSVKYEASTCSYFQFSDICNKYLMLSLPNSSIWGNIKPAQISYYITLDITLLYCYSNDVLKCFYSRFPFFSSSHLLFSSNFEASYFIHILTCIISIFKIIIFWSVLRSWFFVNFIDNKCYVSKTIFASTCTPSYSLF